MRWGDRTAALVVVLSAATGIASGYALSAGSGYAEEAVLPPELTPPPFRLPGGGRLTGVPYAPEGTRLDPLDPSVLNWAAAVEASDLNPLGLRARAYLAAASGRLRDARSLIESAEAVASELPSLAADRVAIELALAEGNEDPLASARALEEAAVAHRREPFSERADFLLAVSLEAVHLPQLAELAWSRGLSRTVRGPWALEARDRLDRIRSLAEAHHMRLKGLRTQSGVELAKSAEASPTDARGYFFDEGLGLRTPHLTTSLEPKRLAIIAAAVAEQTKDPLLVDIVRCLLDPQPAFADGLASLQRARASHLAFDLDRSIAQYRSADPLLRESCPPLADRSRIWMSVALMQQGHEREALATAEGISEETRYPTLRAWRVMLEGWERARNGDTGAAVAIYRRATGFAEMKDLADATWVQGSIATGLVDQRDFAAAWREQIAANASAAMAQDPKYLPWVVEYSAIALGQLGATRAALLLFDSVRRAADQRGDPFSRTQAAWTTAQAAFEAGEVSTAAQLVARSAPLLRQIGDAQLRRNEVARFTFYEALSLLERDPGRARNLLSAILDDNLIDLGLRTETTRYRADAANRLGDRTAAFMDWSASAHGFEEMRRRLHSSGASDRAFFESARDVFERWSSAAWAAGLQRRAIDIADYGRARGLLDAIGADKELPPTTTSESESLLPGDTEAPVLFLEQLSDRLLVAFAWRGRETFFERPWTRRDAQRFNQVALRVANDAGADSEGARTLAIVSSGLLGSLAPQLQGARALFIVPDEDWELFPFALLELPELSVGTDLALSQLPSLRVLAAVLRDLPPRETPTRLLSLVATRPTGSAASPALRALNAARYPYREIRLGSSEPNARAGFQWADVIQVIAHGRRNESPDQIDLDLGSGADGARLTVGDLTAEPLDRRPLVLLGACSAGAGRTLRLEGTLSPARRFLEAGARAVLAAPNDLPDQLMSEVEGRLHVHLANGVHLAEGLRRVRGELGHRRLAIGGLTVLGAPPDSREIALSVRP